MISIDRGMAESIVRDRLRTERAPKLAELDVKFMRALEAGEETPSIIAQKEALRDVTGKSLQGLSLEELASLDLAGAMQL